ncbi:hypothetical protein [Natrononativus amylolyticus]|uniref:hypothetical protein n=1 Tax=Natrononativus amylolyticus TaxID=2963434 RepID=UPI0020CCE871|nr:hypothetical protein [Natrononativus amylolyticus]
MTPVVLLAGFCAIMAAVAVSRVLLADGETIDAGTALVVVAVAVLTLAWATVSTGVTGSPVLIASALGALALVVGCAGIVLIARGW